MNFLNFISENYINILLIFGIILAIFISQTNKNFNNKMLLFLSGISLLFLILIYYEKNILSGSEYILIHKTIFLLLFVFQPIELYLYVLSYFKGKNIYRYLFMFPALVNIVITLMFSKGDLILSFEENGEIIAGPLFYFELVVCCIYLFYTLIHGIYSLIKKETSYGLILILSSIANALSLFIGVKKMTFDIANSSIIFTGVLLFINNYIIEQKNLSANQEKMIQEQRTSLTISQIQPHFLYNSLATIGYLCKKDPITASKAIDQFSDYLRANLNSINKKENVPFLEELKHVKTYVWLEQLRFENRLQVEYDITYTDFLVPSLSIQPLVENAIKHGICNKIEGGKLTIRTIEYLEQVKVVIEDNGVGFDSTVNLNDGRTHVGIENVRSRLKSMSDATLEIRSSVGKGTIATITFNKEKMV